MNYLALTYAIALLGLAGAIIGIFVYRPVSWKR